MRGALRAEGLSPTAENPRHTNGILSALVLGETTCLRTPESAKNNPAKPWRLLSEKSSRDRMGNAELTSLARLTDTVLPSRLLDWFRGGGKPVDLAAPPADKIKD